MPVPEVAPLQVAPETPGSVELQAAPSGAEGVTVEPLPPVPKPVMSGNRAVVALLDLAQRDDEAGRREAAGASLERALRIEPRNPWLWHELARLRLSQGHYAQAITLAQKSSSFAGHDRSLQARNWRVIGNAHVAQGDATGAQLAFKQATDLEQAAQADSNLWN